MGHLLAVSLFAFSLCTVAGDGYSMRFFGNGAYAPGLDRVKIALDSPHRPVDVGAGDFTVEFWIKAFAADNTTGSCVTMGENWIFGNIFLDRDVFGWGDWGDWGASLAGGLVAFGVANTTEARGICSTTNVADGTWHHVALTRRLSDGRLQIFVDGVLEASSTAGPLGDLSYRDGRDSSSWPNEPYLVIGAEKHDAWLDVPAFTGWLDELRLSTVLRYSSNFTPTVVPFESDSATAALYHFDEGGGVILVDSSDAAGGPSHGAVFSGGNPAGPVWSQDTPLRIPAVFSDGFESADTSAWSSAVGTN